MLLYPRTRSLHIFYHRLHGERASVLCIALHFQQLLFQVMADGALVADIVQRGIIQPRDGCQGTVNAFFIAGKMDETIATLSIDILYRETRRSKNISHQASPSEMRKECLLPHQCTTS